MHDIVKKRKSFYSVKSQFPIVKPKLCDCAKIKKKKKQVKTPARYDPIFHMSYRGLSAKGL